MVQSWIPILIPAEHHADITALVRHRLDELGFAGASDGVVEIRLRDDPDSQPHAGGDHAGILDDHDPWAVDNLAALLRNPTTTAQRWVKAIDVCANHVAEFVPTETIAEESGMTVANWRAACRKMTVHQRATYPGETSWPLATASGRAIGRPAGPLYVALTSEQARRWAEAKSMVAAR